MLILLDFSKWLGGLAVSTLLGFLPIGFQLRTSERICGPANLYLALLLCLWCLDKAKCEVLVRVRRLATINAWVMRDRMRRLTASVELYILTTHICT